MAGLQILALRLETLQRLLRERDGLRAAVAARLASGVAVVSGRVGAATQGVLSSAAEKTTEAAAALIRLQIRLVWAALKRVPMAFLKTLRAIYRKRGLVGVLAQVGAWYVCGVVAPIVIRRAAPRMVTLQYVTINRAVDLVLRMVGLGPVVVTELPHDVVGVVNVGPGRVRDTKGRMGTVLIDKIVAYGSGAGGTSQTHCHIEWDTPVVTIRERVSRAVRSALTSQTPPPLPPPSEALKPPGGAASSTATRNAPQTRDVDGAGLGISGPPREFATSDTTPPGFAAKPFPENPAIKARNMMQKPHTHVCLACSARYQHRHPGGDKAHLQGLGQCPNPKCAQFGGSGVESYTHASVDYIPEAHVAQCRSTPIAPPLYVFALESGGLEATGFRMTTGTRAVRGTAAHAVEGPVRFHESEVQEVDMNVTQIDFAYAETAETGLMISTAAPSVGYIDAYDPGFGCWVRTWGDIVWDEGVEGLPGTLVHYINTKPSHSGAPVMGPDHRMVAMHVGASIDGTYNVAYSVASIKSMLYRPPLERNFLRFPWVPEGKTKANKKNRGDFRRSGAFDNAERGDYTFGKKKRVPAKNATSGEIVSAAKVQRQQQAAILRPSIEAILRSHTPVGEYQTGHEEWVEIFQLLQEANDPSTYDVRQRLNQAERHQFWYSKLPSVIKDCLDMAREGRALELDKMVMEDGGSEAGGLRPGLHAATGNRLRAWLLSPMAKSWIEARRKLMRKGGHHVWITGPYRPESASRKAAIGTCLKDVLSSGRLRSAPRANDETRDAIDRKFQPHGVSLSKLATYRSIGGEDAEHAACRVLLTGTPDEAANSIHDAVFGLLNSRQAPQGFPEVDPYSPNGWKSYAPEAILSPPLSARGALWAATGALGTWGTLPIIGAALTAGAAYACVPAVWRLVREGTRDLVPLEERLEINAIVAHLEKPGGPGWADPLLKGTDEDEGEAAVEQWIAPVREDSDLLVWDEEHKEEYVAEGRRPTAKTDRANRRRERPKRRGGEYGPEALFDISTNVAPFTVAPDSCVVCKRGSCTTEKFRAKYSTAPSVQVESAEHKGKAGYKAVLRANDREYWGFASTKSLAEDAAKREWAGINGCYLDQFLCGKCVRNQHAKVSTVTSPDGAMPKRLSRRAFETCSVFDFLRVVGEEVSSAIQPVEGQPELPPGVQKRDLVGKTILNNYNPGGVDDPEVSAILEEIGLARKYAFPPADRGVTLRAYQANADMAISPEIHPPADCAMAVIRSLHLQIGRGRLMDRATFQRKFQDALNAEKMSKSAGSSELLNGLEHSYASLSSRSYTPEFSKSDALAYWGNSEEKLMEFAWLRMIAYAYAPLDGLADTMWAVKQGLILPSKSVLKDEATPARKALDEEGELLELPRFRIIKVQSFEDGLVARLLTNSAKEAELEAFHDSTRYGKTPVLVGGGLAGEGREKYIGHLRAMQDAGPQVFPDDCKGGALGDDYSGSPTDGPGLLTFDASAYDETATPARFDFIGVCVAAGHGDAMDFVAAAASIGYHRALTFQATIVEGWVFAPDPRFGRCAPWPSAVPHTSYGDAVAAAMYGRVINRCSLTKENVQTVAREVGLCFKAIEVGNLDADGASSLSCLWTGKPGQSRMVFQNVEKAIVSSLRSLHTDKAIAIDFLCHDNPEGKAQWRDFLLRVDGLKGTNYIGDVDGADVGRALTALANMEW